MTSLMTASLTILMLTEVAVTTSESSLRLISFFYMKVSLADVLNVSNCCSILDKAEYMAEMQAMKKAI
jgi:hypothetical protein